MPFGLRVRVHAIQSEKHSDELSVICGPGVTRTSIPLCLHSPYSRCTDGIFIF